MIYYDKLFQMLENKGLNKFWLRNNGINPKTIQALSQNKQVNTNTINKLCNILKCTPSDIMEYAPDEE